MKKQDNIEELFQESFKNFEVDPGSNAWANIQSGIQGGASASASIASKAASSWFTTIGVGLVVTSIVVGGYFFFNQQGEGKKASEISREKAKEKISVIEPQKQTDFSNQAIQEPNNSQLDPINNEEVKEANEPIEELQVKDKNSIKASNTDQSKGLNDNDQKPGLRVAKITVVPPAKTAIDFPEKLNAPIEEAMVSKENQTVASESTFEEPEKLIVDQEQTTSVEEDKATKKQAETPLIDAPNAFSPNQDGVNDLFVIKTGDVDAFEINILNTSGKIVFQTKDKSIMWNGNLPDGSLAPKGTYAYQIVVIMENQTFPKSGYVQLIR